MENTEEVLSDSEMRKGWHWCNEFDGLLVGWEMDESQHCSEAAGCPKKTWRAKFKQALRQIKTYFALQYSQSRERKTIGSESAEDF